MYLSDAINVFARYTTLVPRLLGVDNRQFSTIAKSCCIVYHQQFMDILIRITYASSEILDTPAHPDSLTEPLLSVNTKLEHR